MTQGQKDKVSNMLNIEIENVDDVLYITLEGRLNSLTSKQFDQRLQSELENVRRVVLDLANLEYISSAGLRILLAIGQHMETTGGENVCVRNANEMILETLEITGLLSVVNVE